MKRAEDEEVAQFAWENFLDQAVKVNRFMLQSADRVLRGNESGELRRRIKANAEFQYLLHARNCMGHNVDQVAEKKPEYLHIEAPGTPNAIRVPVSSGYNVHISCSHIGSGFIHHLSNYRRNGTVEHVSHGVTVSVTERLFLKDALDSGVTYPVPLNAIGEEMMPDELAQKVHQFFTDEITAIEIQAKALRA